MSPYVMIPANHVDWLASSDFNATWSVNDSARIGSHGSSFNRLPLLQEAIPSLEQALAACPFASTIVASMQGPPMAVVIG